MKKFRLIATVFVFLSVFCITYFCRYYLKPNQSNDESEAKDRREMYSRNDNFIVQMAMMKLFQLK